MHCIRSANLRFVAKTQSHSKLYHKIGDVLSSNHLQDARHKSTQPCQLSFTRDVLFETQGKDLINSQGKKYKPIGIYQVFVLSEVN